MASSAVDVCNIALRRLGVQAIVDLSENTDRAQLCAALYETTRDRILREYKWNFAQIRRTLAVSSTPPAFGFAKQFPLPTSPFCLAVNETDPSDAEYTIENTIDSLGTITGKALLTDETSMSIRYTGRIEDVGQWDASFVDAVAFDLAAQMAYPLTESASKAKEMSSLAQNSLQHARTMDSQEGSIVQADINTLVDIRHHGWIEAFDRNRNSI